MISLILCGASLLIFNSISFYNLNKFNKSISILDDTFNNNSKTLFIERNISHKLSFEKFFCFNQYFDEDYIQSTEGSQINFKDKIINLDKIEIYGKKEINLEFNNNFNLINIKQKIQIFNNFVFLIDNKTQNPIAIIDAYYIDDFYNEIKGKYFYKNYYWIFSGFFMISGVILFFI